MNAVVLTLALLLTQIPKYNPNGRWEASTGTQFDLRLEGSDLHVKLVPGSNPKFLEYQLETKNQGEINSYKGTGSFTAKMEGGKECTFPTEWTVVMVSPERIIGIASNIIADQKTCEIKEKSEIQLDLTKKK